MGHNVKKNYFFCYLRVGGGGFGGLGTILVHIYLLININLHVKDGYNMIRTF